MENEKKETEKLEEGPKGSTARLPWWTELVVAQRHGMKISSTHICHLHHCAGCARTIVCFDVVCRDFQMRCPDCFGKSKTARIALVSQRTFNRGRVSLEHIVKEELSQGGN